MNLQLSRYIKSESGTNQLTPEMNTEFIAAAKTCIQRRRDERDGTFDNIVACWKQEVSNAP